MIKYALGCAGGHQFESWFPDSAAYDTQRKRGLVACPECGSTTVDKAVMAPAVVARASAPSQESAEPLLDAKVKLMRDVIGRLRREIEANTDDVGDKFPQVARAMHVGDEPERAIRGRASPDEARTLIEEGVAVLPIPALADEMN